jgi:hypothetical protein
VRTGVAFGGCALGESCVRKRTALLPYVVLWGALVMASGSGFAADAPPDTALSKQIKALTDALGGSVASDAAAQSALTTLLTELGTVACGTDSASKVTCKIAQLKAFADSAASSVGNSTNELTHDQYQQLLLALQKVLAVPEQAASGNDKNLLQAIDAVAKIVNLTPKANDPKAVAQRMGDLNTQIYSRLISAFGVSKTLWIRIDGAWFGELASIRDALKSHSYKGNDGMPGGLGPWAQGTRFCSATRAIRARCQGKTQCYEPADAGNSQQAQTTTNSSPSTKTSGDGTADEITGAKMCGYEPAPFADPRQRGLIVRYRCLDPADVNWINFAEFDDRPGTSYITTNLADHEAQLRLNSLMTLQCPPPSLPGTPQQPQQQQQQQQGGSTAATVTVPSSITIKVQGASPSN